MVDKVYYIVIAAHQRTDATAPRADDPTDSDSLADNIRKWAHYGYARSGKGGVSQIQAGKS